MSKQKNPQKTKKYNFFGEWKRHFNDLKIKPPVKEGKPPKKKNKWLSFLIYGLLFWYSFRSRAITSDKLVSLEQLSATALMHSSPAVDNWIASEWNYKDKSFKILYIKTPFVPMVKSSAYSNGRFYNTTIEPDYEMEWYCKTYKNFQNVPTLSWAFPSQVVNQYCLS